MVERPRVGLFVTCLVDLYRPTIGFACIRLLEEAGCDVVVPEGQTCCGQPAWNSGDDASTRELARGLIDSFDGVDYVIIPSGSCAGMFRHFPELFEAEPAMAERAAELANRTHEIMSFLVDVRDYRLPAVHFNQRVTYHDSCTGLRELGIKTQPRTLLDQVDGLELEEMDDTEVCCGFGGTFCVKFPGISERMVDDKVALARQTDADTLLGGDLGCLLNIAGRLSRLGVPMDVRHAVEVLADLAEQPAIGAAADAAGAQVAADHDR